MVQMKDILCVSIKNILYILYIPHGSDEREKLYKAWIDSFGFHFISHMVQMKVSHLYLYHLFPAAFISHMVQMKVDPYSLKKQGMIALYPTWFR